MQIEIGALLETLQQFEQNYNQAQNKEDLEDMIRQLLTFTCIYTFQLVCLLEEIEKQQDFWNQLQQGIQNQERKNTAYVEQAFQEVDSYREQYLSQLETCRILEEKLNQQDYTNKLLQDSLANELQQSNFNIRSLQQQYSQYLEQLKEQLEQKDFYISKLSEQIQEIQKNQEEDALSTKEDKQLLISVRDINIQQSSNELPNILKSQSTDKDLHQTLHKSVSIQEFKQNSKTDSNSNSKPPSNSILPQLQQNENYFQFGKPEEQQRNFKQTLFHIEYTSPFIKSQFASKLHSRINSLAIFEQINNTVQLQNLSQQSDPYFQFFQLISQCVKLDQKNNRFYSISVQHLYQTFKDQKIPFNKWYKKIYEYLIKN